MIPSFQKQPQIRILPAFRLDGRSRLRETDLKELVPERFTTLTIPSGEQVS